MKLVFCGFAVLLALPLFAQKALTNEDVVRMVQTGIPQGTIITAIAEAPSVQFNFMAGYLMNGSVPDEVVRAMAAKAYGRPIPGYKPSPKEATGRAPEVDSVDAKPTTVSPLPIVAGPTSQAVTPQAVLPQNRPLRSVTVVGVKTEGEEGHGIQLGSVGGFGAVGQQPLSRSEVTKAIADSHGKQRRNGLVLQDKQTLFGTAMLCRTCAVSGYVIHVYTPEQWIQQLAVNAYREMLPFSEQDVTPEMRMRMLHVVAMPSTPTYLTGNGFGFSSSVHRIVLTDSTRQTIIQPQELGNGVVQSNSAFRSAEFSTAHAAFLMSDVDALRASDGKQEFFITVTGDRQNKFFRVKQRFFKQLFN